MNKDLSSNLLRLRVLVGGLGEQATPRWWNTNFLNETSGTFLSHIYTRTYRAAQFQGMKAAACKIHDDFIGVGRVYHLFRLPEEIEYNLNNLILTEANRLDDFFLQAQDSAKTLDELSHLTGGNKASSTGPILLGKINVLNKSSTISILAQYYLGAFSENVKTFPYFSD